MQRTTPASRPSKDETATGRFSILQLLLITAAAGCWFAFLQANPHVAVFASGVAAAAIVTCYWIRVRQRRMHAIFRLITISFVLISWFYLYVVSIGPARMISSKLYDRDDMSAVYAPVGWLHANTPLQEPLEKYSELWK